MGRKIYEPTQNQLSKWSEPGLDIDAQMPADEYFKTRNGKKVKAWGMKKRDYKLGLMTVTFEYQTGIWQGRVDAINGLNYAEERNENTYNLGYYRGYTNFRSDWKGFDSATRARFTETYGEKNEI